MHTRQLGTGTHPTPCWKGCTDQAVNMEQCQPGDRGYPGHRLRCMTCGGEWYGKTPDEAWDARITGGVS